MQSNWEMACAMARQSKADFETFDVLRGNQDVPPCHAFHFLQMACEKLCKSRLWATTNPPESIEKSHRFVKSHLPRILKNTLKNQSLASNDLIKLMNKGYLQDISGHIERLNPAVERTTFPENCEYPWIDGATGKTISPLDHVFQVDRALRNVNFGLPFIKALQASISDAVETYCR